jgi:hypothetical protein
VKTVSSFLVGLGVGALAVVLLQRFNECQESEDPTKLVDKIADQLALLENQAKSKPTVKRA